MTTPDNSFSSSSSVMLFSIHQCRVTRVEKYGAFLEFMDGVCDERGRPKSGLLHVSQMAETRVENPEMVVEVGEKLWAKVIRVDADGKLSLTIRNVRQSDGTDLDPGNTKITERAPQSDAGGSFRRFKPIELGAVVNTVCTRCGGKGHTKYECFAGASKLSLKDGLDPVASAAKYDFVDSSDDDEAYFKAFQKPEAQKAVWDNNSDSTMTVKKAFEILRKEEKRKSKKKGKKSRKRKHKSRSRSSSSSSSSSSASGSSSPSSTSHSPSSSSYSSCGSYSSSPSPPPSSSSSSSKRRTSKKSRSASPRRN